MPNPTTRLGLTKPTIDNTTVWGDQLNTDLDIVDAGVEILADKDQANGYPSLDATGKVPISEIPVSAVVGGNAMDIQFNNGAGGFGGSDSLIWNNAVGLLAISNLTAATALTPQNSPIVSLNGAYWNWAGPASATDSWQIQSALTAGKTFTVTNSSESAVSVVTLTVPGHTFLVGEFITVTGLTNVPWINGLRLQVIGIPFSTNLVRVIDTTHHGTQGSGVENATAVSYPATDLSITHSGSSGFAQVAMPAALVGVPATSLSPAAQDFLLIGASEAGTFRVFTNNNSEDGGAVLLFNDVQDVSNRNISGTISTLMLTPQANVTLGNGAAFGTVLACYHEGNFNYSSMIGVQINIGSDPTGDIGGSATISEMIALDVEPPFGPVSGGGVTTSTSIRLGDCNGSFLGTIGTSYAINIAAQTNGGTSHWAIFEADATCFNQLGPTTFLGSVTFQGSSTGSAAISVAAAAGTPNRLVLPIATGASGAVLATDGGNPQQLSWTAPSALTILWNNLQNATGNLTLANAGFNTTFNQTSAVNWTWANTTAATSGTSQSSPIFNVNGTYWTGAASAADSWTIQNVVGNGTNGTSSLTFTHSGTSGSSRVFMPLLDVTGALGFTTQAAAGGITGGNSYRFTANSNDSWSLGVNSSNAALFAASAGGIIAWSNGRPQSNAILASISQASGVVQIGTTATGDTGGSLSLKSITLSDTAASTDFTIQNTTAATSGVSQTSPAMAINGRYWDGAASQVDSWTIQNVQTNGTNGSSKLTFTHTGSSSGANSLNIVGASILNYPNWIIQGNPFSLSNVNMQGFSVAATNHAAATRSNTTSSYIGLLFGNGNTFAGAVATQWGSQYGTSFGQVSTDTLGARLFFAPSTAGPKFVAFAIMPQISETSTNVSDYTVLQVNAQEDAFLGTNALLMDCQISSKITNAAEDAGSIVTLTVVNNKAIAGQQVYIEACNTFTWLNGLVVTLTTASATSVTFTDPTTHGTQASVAQQGRISLTQWKMNTVGGVTGLGTWTQDNPIAATASVSQSSPSMVWAGRYWTSVASAVDSWTIQNVIANGTNGTSQLTFTHSGSSGAAQVLFPKGTTANPGIAFAAAPGDGMWLDGSNNLLVQNANSGARITIQSGNTATLESGNGANVTCFGNALKTVGISGGSLQIVNTGVIGWSSNSTSTTAPDAAFSRLGAASVALGNGTTGDFTGSLKLGAMTLTAAAPTVAAAQVGLGSTTAATATAGAATLPANPVGFLIINVAGTQMKIPYYNT